jgi:alpha-methylacyl-CoA racemase
MVDPLASDDQEAAVDQKGPLRGLRVVELASIGPGPFAAMLLSDLGADVIRVEGRHDPVGVSMDRRFDVLLRGRPAIEVNLKESGAAERVLRLVDRADVLIEGWRPGVAERLGVGPKDCLNRNPRLIYGRMTGWGQDGPMAGVPGHDINYLALSGVLDMCGRAGQPPTPPLNLVGDFGGGGMLLALGLLAALWETSTSNLGQVVDAAMVDGAALLASVFAGLRAGGMWSATRGTNLVDSGAPFYEVYETADGKYVALGAIEAKFQVKLYDLLGLTDLMPDVRTSAESWPATKELLSHVFSQRTRDEWCSVFEGQETCFTPVLSADEAYRHPHNAARNTFITVDGLIQPAPAPRFSRTALGEPRGPADRSAWGESLRRWLVDSEGFVNQQASDSGGSRCES